MKKYLGILLMVLCIGIIFFTSHRAFAITTDYSVKANIPENQINKDLTYFDLRMNPGDKQELSLTFHNNSDKPIEIMVEPNTAITNQNGVIDYSSSKKEKDSSLLYAFSDVISEKQKVVLEAYETKDVIFTLEMPKKSFDGIILGGFYIYQLEKEEYVQTAQIENKYAYVIGVKLSETDTEVKPDLRLNEVQSTLINYRTAVIVNLQNIEAINIKNLEVTAKVTKEGGKEVLHETTKAGMSMAPNSNFNFPISWDNKLLEAGSYHLYLVATDGDQIWEFDKIFVIEGKIASELNDEAIELERDYTWIYVAISIIATVIVMGIILLIMKKRDKDQEKKNV